MDKPQSMVIGGSVRKKTLSSAAGKKSTRAAGEAVTTGTGQLTASTSTKVNLFSYSIYTHRHSLFLFFRLSFFLCFSFPYFAFLHTGDC